MRRRHLGLTICFSSLFVVLFHFQNCGGPADGQYTGQDDSVEMIDNYYQEKLNFVENKIEVFHQSETVTIDGLCTQANSGEKFVWSLIERGLNEVRQVGESFCERGGFRVNLTDLHQMECDTEYWLVAETESGESDVLALEKKCAPIAALEVAAESSQGATQMVAEKCFLELTELQDTNERLCQRSCYRNEKLYNRIALTANACDSL